MKLFDKLFRYEAIDRIFSDQAYIQALLDFEAALARAEAKAGVIPAADAQIIAAACHADQFHAEELAAQAALSGNVAIPLVKKLTELVAKQNKDAARFVHWGATSQDAMDTGVVLQLRRALEVVEQDLACLTSTLASLADKHCATPVCCVKPADHRGPVAPAPLPISCQNEWHAVPATISSWLTLPSLRADELHSHWATPPSVTAIPLFQRDCCYLI